MPPGSNVGPVLINRVTIRGFIVSDQAPRAFIGLLRGENLGRMLVRVGPDPTR